VGAARALLSLAARREMETAVRGVVKIETATEPQFQQLFVEAMAFPHKTAPSTYLGTVVTLPAPIESAGGDHADRGRRRRRSSIGSVDDTGSTVTVGGQP
jgi:uncharacterized 2Fe-2S/4Fe-4S cluster protein (DUF4445 family)